MVTRMTTNQRWQHLLLLVSFIVLVVTGFALKYPDSWLAVALGMSERLRSLTHRIAGVVMIGAGVYHLVYITLTRSGRRLILDFAPGRKTPLDAWGTMRYYLGLSPHKPQFSRFNYAEKAEYWALVWGSVLMAVTGIMMWAKVTVGSLLARWCVDAATAIHFYEAVLATLAIVVWHFYQVFFDPDVYPMNWAWWDGKMSRKHYEEEHALDKETLNPATPAPPSTRMDAPAKQSDSEKNQERKNNHEIRHSGFSIARGDFHHSLGAGWSRPLQIKVRRMSRRRRPRGRAKPRRR